VDKSKIVAPLQQGLRRSRQRVFERTNINVSGVQNSWLTLLKKAVFARSISASAPARLRSSS